MPFMKKAEVLMGLGRHQALCPGDDGGAHGVQGFICCAGLRDAVPNCPPLHSKTLLESFAEGYY